jgi:hypothetical protein
MTNEAPGGTRYEKLFPLASHATVSRLASLLGSELRKQQAECNQEAEWTLEPAWRIASFCAARECVEVAQRGDVILLRDSMQPRGGVLHCAAEEWRSFVGYVKAGQLDGLGS